MTKEVDINKISINEDNPRYIEEDKLEKLKKSIKEFPEMLKLRPIVVDETDTILGGNMRYKACKELGMDKVWVVKSDELTEEQKKEFIIKDNLSAGEWDYDIMATIWEAEELEDWGMDVPLDGDSEEEKQEAHNTLLERFIIPPFSILDTRKGYWMDRKRAWNTLMGDTTETREGVLGMQNFHIDDKSKDPTPGSFNSGVSIFDPVLAELINTWFAPEDANICDPFAGGTFGYVAGYKGNTFTGIELRQEQCDANNKRTDKFDVTYICDDGQNILDHVDEGTQDLMFSCPPYYDLEVYSDNEGDISNSESYEDFLEVVDKAFTDGLKTLKDNRFAVIVVGDIRNNDHFYRRFVDDINNIMVKGDAYLYNELILAEPLGTLPQRVARYMGNRKVGKCHQNVLVYFKGDPMAIKQIFPKLELIPDFDINLI